MHPDAHGWLTGEIAAAIAAAIEGYTAERPRVQTRELPADASTAEFRWRQTFSSLPGAAWMVCAQADWHALASGMMQAAGIEESDPEKLKSEFLEILRQSFASAARAISARIGAESACEAGAESSAEASGACWSEIEIKTDAWTAQLAFGCEPALLAALTPAAGELEPAAPKSKTYDLLLDVELPVSISFGRAQVALKDVIKLTTGSIVDLNRDIADPVEVIVNNCVIARGEVVVIGGNFGVRIQHVISRQERLRTLK